MPQLLKAREMKRREKGGGEVEREGERKNEGRREKGEGRREKGEGRRKAHTRMFGLHDRSVVFSHCNEQHKEMSRSRERERERVSVCVSV